MTSRFLTVIDGSMQMATLPQSGGNQFRGASIPSNPALGDSWLELASDGNPSYGWNWILDSYQWFSPETTIVTTIPPSTVEQFFRFPLDSRFELFLKNIQVDILLSSNQSSSNRWIVRLEQISSSNVATTISEQLTQSLSINVFNTLDFAVNRAFYRSNTKLLNVRLIPENSAGSILGAIRFNYKLLRTQTLVPTYSQSSTQGSFSASFPSLNDFSITTGVVTTSSSLSWVQATFAAEVTPSRITLGAGFLPGYGGTASQQSSMKLEYSLNGSSWSEIVFNKTLTDTAPNQFQRITIPGITARFWRVSRPGVLALTEFRFD